MPISLRSDQPAGPANDLTPAQVDQNWTSLFGTPSLLTIVAGVITVNGAGTYRINPESGTADDVTAIAGATRVGDELTLLNQTSGHVITYRHQGNLHLTGVDFTSDTIYCTLKLKCVATAPMTWVELSRSSNT